MSSLAAEASAVYPLLGLLPVLDSHWLVATHDALLHLVLSSRFCPIEVGLDDLASSAHASARRHKTHNASDPSMVPSGHGGSRNHFGQSATITGASAIGYARPVTLPWCPVTPFSRQIHCFSLYTLFPFVLVLLFPMPLYQGRMRGPHSICNAKLYQRHAMKAEGW